MAEDRETGALDHELPPNPPPAEVAPSAFGLRTAAVAGLFALAAIFALYVARPVFLPLTMALLLSLLLRPPVRWLEQRRVPTVLGAMIVLVVLATPAVWGAAQLWEPAVGWVQRAPENLQKIQQKTLPLRRHVAQIGQAAEQVEKLATPGASAPGGRPANQEVVVHEPRLIQAALAGLQGLAVEAGITVALLFFLLAYGDLFLEKLVRVLPTLSEKKRAVEIAHDIERQVSAYLLTVTLINGALGAGVGIAMTLVGMPNPWLWGVLAALLNFVPYLGATAGITIVAFVALVTFPTIGHALLAPGCYLGIAVIEGNFVTPIILGRRFSLNPIVIFVWLLFWGWMWGIGGALLAVPLLAALKIACDHFAVLEPVGEFLAL